MSFGDKAAHGASDEDVSSLVLSDIMRENNVYIGGSSLGKGFRRAARYFLRKEAPFLVENERMKSIKSSSFLPHQQNRRLGSNASQLVNEGVDFRVEDPFHVLDIGIIMSQLYQWRKYFPRVEPFYAVKCNPDPVIVKTLAALGCHFDCASREEIRLVQGIASDLPPPFSSPDIVYANPTKGRSHIIEAVCRGVTLMTYDNVPEVKKCASVSRHIKLLLRIVTDDSGSQCRLSSKYGAPRSMWRELLSAAKKHGLEVVGVSFHVGSGCRDSSRYEMALRDARDLFDLASLPEFGFDMSILDIGGGFPGEMHSLWDPATVFGDPTAPDAHLPPSQRRKYSIDGEIEDDGADDAEEEIDETEGFEKGGDETADASSARPLMFFTDIAKVVSPMLDELFPRESGVRIIAEPGRYFVAAAGTHVTSVIGVRSNAITADAKPQEFSDRDAAANVDRITRAEEDVLIQDQGQLYETPPSASDNPMVSSIVSQIADYSKLYTQMDLSQQEMDVYMDKVDLSQPNVDSTQGLLSPPANSGDLRQNHTVEGMTMGIVSGCLDESERPAGADCVGVPSDAAIAAATAAATAGGMLASFGEAAVSGVVKQVMADSSPALLDDFAYYINDGVYGAFNNLMFDHATVRPRRLKWAIAKSHCIVISKTHGGLRALEAVENAYDASSEEEEDGTNKSGGDTSLYPSTVFGPTCDSMDVISRSVLLPKLSIGDWLYFQNMGAYTSAAASSFNGFIPTRTFYVCSIHPDQFDALWDGVTVKANGTTMGVGCEEEKKSEPS